MISKRVTLSINAITATTEDYNLNAGELEEQDHVDENWGHGLKKPVCDHQAC